MKCLYFVSILLFCSHILLGQEKLNKLSAPTSPAASALGILSTTILAPKSYQALEATIYSNFLNSEKQVAIPNDFSLEFTPYWTANHSLSIEDYLFPNSLGKQIIRNSSFSIASTQKFLLGDSTATNGLAFGYRTTIYFGNKNDHEKIIAYKTQLNKLEELKPKIQEIAYELFDKNIKLNNSKFLEQIQKPATDTILKYLKYKSIEDVEIIIKTIFEDAKDLPIITKENHDEFIDAFTNLFDAKTDRNKLFNEFKAYINERQGWSIDIAFAGFANFPTNNFNCSAVPRQSLWITPTYRFKDNLSHLKILSVFRYEWYNLGYWQKYFPNYQVYKNNIDYGLGIAGEFQKFAIQFEAIGRRSNSEISEGKDSQGYMLYRKEQNSDFQCIGSFSYNVSDQIVLTYSFGNKFEPIQNPNNTLVSQLTLNFGFGTPDKNQIK